MMHLTCTKPDWLLWSFCTEIQTLSRNVSGEGEGGRGEQSSRWGASGSRCCLASLGSSSQDPGEPGCVLQQVLHRRHSAVTWSRLTAVRGTSDSQASLGLEGRCCRGLGSCLPGHRLWHPSLLAGLRAACWQVKRECRPSPSALEGATPTYLEGHLLLSFYTVLPPASGALRHQEGSGTVLPPRDPLRPHGAQNRKISCSVFPFVGGKSSCIQNLV